MPLDEQKRKLIEAALATKQVATRSDPLERFLPEITVSADYVAYLNPRVTLMVDTSVTFEVTHLKFTPVPEAGYVALQVSLPDEAGAEAFTRGDSGRTGTVSMKAALQAVNLTVPAERKLKLPVESNTVTFDGQERTLVLIEVKRPARKKALVRPRKTSAAATPATTLAAGKQTEPATKQPPTNPGGAEQKA